ncbi:MAG: potassium channel family protein, partial [Thermotogota bacterium]
MTGDHVSVQDIPAINLIKQIIIVFSLIIGVIFTGIVGYMVLEDFNFQDAFFLTSITISTVGYTFPEGISSAGVYFTMILIALGVSVVLYGVTSITGAVVEGRVNVIMKLRRYRKMIEKMSGHVIVVGAGRTGRFVMLELQQLGKPFVIIDQEKENIDRVKDIIKDEFPYILGDATDEDVLLNAGIKKASSIIVTLPTDSLNVYVVLSAKTLNP